MQVTDEGAGVCLSTGLRLCYLLHKGDITEAVWCVCGWSKCMHVCACTHTHHHTQKQAETRAISPVKTHGDVFIAGILSPSTLSVHLTHPLRYIAVIRGDKLTVDTL